MALGKLDQDFINLKIKFDKEQAEKSVKTIKQELRQAQEEALKLGRKFGENSKEANNAAKKVAQLKDEVGDFKQKVDALNPDKFARFSTATNGIVRGFQAAQGAAVLFGNESEDLQKSLVKLQAVMAFADGIQGVMDTTKAFSGLGNTIKNSVVKAFTTLKGAIIGTGIGALAIALGYVITNFDKVKAAVERFLPGLATLAKYVGVIVEKFTDWVGITSEEGRALDALTAKNNKANESIERQIKLLEARGGKDKEVFALRRQLIDNELAILRAKYRTEEGLTQEELKRFNDLKTEREILLIEETNRIKAEQDKQAKIIKDANDQKAKEREAERQKELQAQLDDIKMLNKMGKEREDATILQAQRMMTIKETGHKVETAADQEMNKKVQENLEQLKSFREKYQEWVKNHNRKATEEEKKFRKELNDLSIMAATSLVQTLQDLNNAYAGKSLEAQKKQFKINKALAISQTVINTYQSASSAAKVEPYPLGVALAGLAVIQGFARVKAIKDQTFEGETGNVSANTSGGGGSVSPRVASTGFTSIAPPTSPQRQTQTKTDPIQVYVLEKDIKKAGNSADNRQAKAIVK